MESTKTSNDQKDKNLEETEQYKVNKESKEPKENSMFSRMMHYNEFWSDMNSEMFTEQFRTSQSPTITCLTCVDSRILPKQIFGITSISQMFTVRNAGNQV